MNKGPSTWAFAVITLVYLGIACWASLYVEPTNKAGEWGDSLAGVFSPLAFLWLLYTALAQRAELELQRLELKENNETQKEQKLQMSRQADALDAQIELLVFQAAAQYEPIFILTRTNLGGSISIKNVGATVRDIYISRDHENLQFVGDAEEAAARPSSYVNFWPASCSLPVVDYNPGGLRNFNFSLSYARLDGVKQRMNLAYDHKNSRISLIEKERIQEQA